MPRNGSGQYTPPTNSWNPPINGVLATAADWQAMLDDLSGAITGSVSADGQTTLTGSLDMGGNQLDNLGAPTGDGSALRWQQLTKGADIASASTIAIPNEGAAFDVTGTTTITAFSGSFPGRIVYLQFLAELTIQNSSSLTLPGGVNITTIVGDVFAFENTDAGIWKCVLYPGRISASSGIIMTGGFKNLIINGRLYFNRYRYVSATATTTPNQYVLDRWRVVVSGQSLSLAPSGTGNIGSAPSGGVEQVIEGDNIPGGTYVCSWEGTATVTINGTPRAKGEPFTLPSSANATVRLSSGTFSNVQLEPGSTATTFENRPVGIEEILCRRYLPSVDYDGQGIIGSGGILGANSAGIRLPISVPPRVPPTGIRVLGPIGNLGVQNYTGGVGTCNAVTFTNSSFQYVKVAATVNGSPFTTSGAEAELFSGPVDFSILLTGCEL